MSSRSRSLCESPIMMHPGQLARLEVEVSSLGSTWRPIEWTFSLKLRYAPSLILRSAARDPSRCRTPSSNAWRSNGVFAQSTLGSEVPLERFAVEMEVEEDRVEAALDLPQRAFQRSDPGREGPAEEEVRSP